MKKIYMFLAFALCASLATAQVEVTFNVDMNAEGASADGIFVTGSWMAAAGLGGDWQEPGSNTDAQLTDDDGDGIFTLTVTMAAGDYFYKYSNGTGWPNAEAGGGGDNYQADLSGCDGQDNGYGGYNRTVTIPDQESYTLDLFSFNSCNITVDVKNLSTITDISIVPNPATEKATVLFTNLNNVDHNVVVTSLTGQVVDQFYSVNGNNLEINTSAYSAGMYFITFTNEKGEQGTEKLIVR